MTPNDMTLMTIKTELIAPNSVAASETTAQKFLDDIHQSCLPSTWHNVEMYAGSIAVDALMVGAVGSVAPGLGTLYGGAVGGVIGAVEAKEVLDLETTKCEYGKLHDLIIDQNK
jgi:hypothetical protein